MGTLGRLLGGVIVVGIGSAFMMVGMGTAGQALTDLGLRIK